MYTQTHTHTCTYTHHSPENEQSQLTARPLQSNLKLFFLNGCIPYDIPLVPSCHTHKQWGFSKVMLKLASVQCNTHDNDLQIHAIPHNLHTHTHTHTQTRINTYEGKSYLHRNTVDANCRSRSMQNKLDDLPEQFDPAFHVQEATISCWVN